MDNMNMDTLALAAQRAYSATVGRGAIAIAVTGTSDEAGSPEFARAIAIAGSNFGKRVLLIKSCRKTDSQCDYGCDLESVKLRAIPETERLSVLEVPTGTELHSKLNDSMQLSSVLSGWTSAFDAIIIDCPAYGVAAPAIYTPMTASAADAVLLVTMPGTLPRQEFDAISQWLAESGAELSAIVLNDRHNPTLAQEIVREAGRLKTIWPGFPEFIARKLTAFPLLNRYN